MDFTQEEVDKMVEKAAFEAWNQAIPRAVIVYDRTLRTIAVNEIDAIDDEVLAVVLSDGSCQYYKNNSVGKVTKIKFHPYNFKKEA